MSKTRAEALLEYLYTIVDEIIKNNDYQIKVGFLGNSIESYSIDKLPTEAPVEHWITGQTRYHDIYNFRTRKRFTSDQSQELNNIGFFEQFEKAIRDNNRQGKLPEIEGIESIKCLNCGSINFAQDNTCEMSIQIEIIYMEANNDSNI